MSIDLFNTRTLLAAIEQAKPPRNFLQEMFFPEVPALDSEYIDVDIWKGKRRLAPFVRPTAEGKLVERTGYSTSSYKPPYIKQKMATTVKDVIRRQMGNTIYQGSNPGQRAAEQLGRDMTELWNMIRRREEWMAAQVLFDGTVNIVGDGINDVIDFQMPASHKVTLTGTALWTDTATADPIGNLRTWRRLIAQDSGTNPPVAILGSAVADALFKYTGANFTLNTRRADFGEINLTDVQESGATYLGELPRGLELYTYDEYYIDEVTGVETPMVPPDRIYIGCRNSRSALHHAVIQDLESSFAVPYFAKSWVEEDPSVRMLMMQSAPLVAMHQPDCFMSIKAV